MCQILETVKRDFYAKLHGEGGRRICAGGGGQRAHSKETGAPTGHQAGLGGNGSGEGTWAGCILRQRYYPLGRVAVLPRRRMELSPIRRRESLTGRWGHRCISYCITMQPRKGACCLAAGCSIGTARICEDGLLVWADDRRQGCSRFRFYLQGTVTYPVRILPNSSKD